MRVALRLTGHTKAALRLDFPLSPVWEALARLGRDQGERIILRRLFRILQLQGVEPAGLSKAAFGRVRTYLHETGAVRPDAIYRNMVKAWNHLNGLLRSSPI